MNSPLSIRLLLVAGDTRLIRAFRILDEERVFEMVRFSSLIGALKKAKDDPAAVVVVQWNAGEVAKQIAAIDHTVIRCVESRLFFYIPDLPMESRPDGEEIRFTLFQIGTTVVFSTLRELSALFPALRRASEHCFVWQDIPKKSLAETIRERLPW